MQQGLAARKKIALKFLLGLRPASLRRLAQHGLTTHGLGIATDTEQQAASIFRLPMRIASVSRER